MMTPKRDPNAPPDPNENRPIHTEQHPAGQEVNRDNPVPPGPAGGTPSDAPDNKPPGGGGPPGGKPPGGGKPPEVDMPPAAPAKGKHDDDDDDKPVKKK
jgi:hypothetical protein